MVTWEAIADDIYEDETLQQRLIRVFRKYEGQETDERDGSNRVVKVTAASFARHFGIVERTFQNWLNPYVPDPKVSANVAPTSPEAPAQEPEPVQEPANQQVRPAPQPNEPVAAPTAPEPVKTVFDGIQTVFSFGDIFYSCEEQLTALAGMVAEHPNIEEVRPLIEAGCRELIDQATAILSLLSFDPSQLLD